MQDWGVFGAMTNTREQKIQSAIDWLPIAGFVYGMSQDQVSKKTGTYQLIKENVLSQIKVQKQTTEGKNFWEGTTLGATDITTPKPAEIFPPLAWDWGKIGQYALYGIIGLAGVW